MNKNGISLDRKKYLRNKQKNKITIITIQIAITVLFLFLWEFLANKGIIDSFIASQPSRIIKTFMNLSTNDLLKHIGVTCFETIVGFLLGTTLGIFIAILLWSFNFLSKIVEPFLVVLNSLPKIALRTSNNNMGWSWNFCNYCYGIINFSNSNNT